MTISDQNDELPPEQCRKKLPDWEMWRQRNGCRLWAGVMLSMNWEPSVLAREWMEEREPDTYAQYERRLKIVKGAYGVSTLMPTIAHELAGETLRNKWILLTDLLAFGKECRWPDIRFFEEGMNQELSLDSARGTDEKQEDVESPNFEDMEKGHRYTLLRFGALLKLVESWMLSNGSINKRAYLNGNKLNYSAMGTELEKLLSREETDGTQTPYTNFTAQTISRQLASALSAFNSR